MSQVQLPSLYASKSAAFKAPFAYFKPSKAPAAFARSANVTQLIKDGQLGFFFIPLRDNEDDRPTAQALAFENAVPLLVAYAVEGFEPSASSNLSLDRSGPFRVVNKENGAEIARGEYSYDEVMRQHKVGSVPLPAGIKLVRYTYIYINGNTYRLKLNSTLERGIELAVKQVYLSQGAKVGSVYVTQLCQEEHFWSLSQLNENGVPSFVQITKEGERAQKGYSGDIYFMPHIRAQFISDAELTAKIKALREQIRASFIAPRTDTDEHAEPTATQALPSIDFVEEKNDLPF